MDSVGWSSPKPGMGPELTMLKLAKAHQVKMPKTKEQGVRVLVRALAIERLLADDPNTSKYYEDKQIKEWMLQQPQLGHSKRLHIWISAWISSSIML